jgi:V/A-type H+-transporting ATPase subunit F
MRSFCICEKAETQTVMRLGGIESRIVSDDGVAEELIRTLIVNEDIGLIMVSENIHRRLSKMIMSLKLGETDKLIIQIPEPEGLQDKDYMMKYINHSIGIHL